MISQETIDLIKQKAIITEVVGDFIQLKKNGSNYVAVCPFHDEKTPSFTIKPGENFYKCFGCGKGADSIGFLQDYKKWTFNEAITHLANKYKIQVEIDGAKKEYIKPEWRNNTNLSDKVVKWFNDVRKISQATLKMMNIGESIQWMPEHKYKVNIKGKQEIKTIDSGDRTVIEFNYFRNKEFVNSKFRCSAKSMRMIKDAELIFYNIDSLIGAKEAFIVEGEPDTLTLIECGVMTGTTGVVSVPNGANMKANNMAYLDSAIELFDSIEKIYIATDNDDAGRKLREDLAERLGKDKCYYIEWKDCKDANEVLVKYGKQGVLECISSPKEFPIVGAFAPSTFSYDVDDMYVNGLDPGCGIGQSGFDKLLRFAKGYITVVTGIPSHGKSSFVDQIILGLSLKHGWKCAFYSPENKPTKLHIANLAKKLIGKDWFGRNRITQQEKDLVMRYLEGKFWFIKPEKDFTIDSILDTVKKLKKQKGIDCFVLDAWNRLEHKYGGNATETKYINEALTKIDSFCEMNSVHCFLVAHPTKLEKDKKTGKYPVPTLYNISGAAHFYNITANGISVYREFGQFDRESGTFSGGETQIYVQKVKFSHWGEVGRIDMKFDKESGRFNESAAGNVIYDYSNWITGQNQQRKIDMPEDEEPIDPNAGIITNDDMDIPF